MTAEDPKIIAKREIKLKVLCVSGLPEDVQGVTVKKRPGDEEYYIVLNGSDPEAWQDTFLHECCHIWNRDLDTAGAIQEQEARAEAAEAQFKQKHDRRTAETSLLFE